MNKRYLILGIGSATMTALGIAGMVANEIDIRKSCKECWNGKVDKSFFSYRHPFNISETIEKNIDESMAYYAKRNIACLTIIAMALPIAIVSFVKVK